jgi:demethylmenaquinone methyltransferase/2-methoxy-6-polyprenyl-1,4-benzoquinol methylase
VAEGADGLIARQLRYYRARAAEHTRRVTATIVDRLGISGDVLELACGTGSGRTSLTGRPRRGNRLPLRVALACALIKRLATFG